MQRYKKKLNLTSFSATLFHSFLAKNLSYYSWHDCYVIEQFTHLLILSVDTALVDEDGSAIVVETSVANRDDGSDDGVINHFPSSQSFLHANMQFARNKY